MQAGSSEAELCRINASAGHRNLWRGFVNHKIQIKKLLFFKSLEDRYDSLASDLHQTNM